ncbi:hypothetical protein ACFV98_04935 [Streptomyces violascens]|uniref:hypothetical protein n=1 Tax=Streptomyces violascens TaxID=67381 RepID=UPI00365BD9F4
MPPADAMAAHHQGVGPMRVQVGHTMGPADTGRLLLDRTGGPRQDPAAEPAVP